MSLKPFSSLILRELIKEIGCLNEGVNRPITQWAETMTTTCGQELEEHPVVYLTESEDYEARKHLSHFKKSRKIDVAENAINVVRGKHAAEIREALKKRHHGWPVFAEHEGTEEGPYTFPMDDQAATSFNEWFAVTSVWRLTLAMPDISYQSATIGTATCRIKPLPLPWKESLDECLKVTEASAIVPVPKCWDLPLRRRDIDSILPTENLETHETGLLTNGIISSWFQILVAHREQSRPGCTVFIPPDSLDMVGSKPWQVAQRKWIMNAKIDMVIFPTIVKEQDHCVLVVAYPRKKIVAVLDSKGNESTSRLQEDRPWIEQKHSQRSDDWQVTWLECPHQKAEGACGIFMLINALCLIMIKAPTIMYTCHDAMFLRRYVAAVICMGKLPDEP